MNKLAKQKVEGKEISVMGGKGKIGVVLMFAVGSCEVPAKEIKAWVKSQKVLAEEDLPNEPSKFDAFQCACSMENTRIWEKLNDKKLVALENLPGERMSTMYVTLPSKSGKGEYILERRVWTKDGTVVSPQHPNVAKLMFDGQDVSVEMFDGFRDWELQEAIEDILKAEYERQQDIVNGTRHRQALYKLIERHRGIHFIGGMSTWFVPQSAEVQIEAFQDYLNTVASKHKTTAYPTEMRVLDVVDTEQMRQDVARDVAREVQVKYEKILDETQSYLEKVNNKEKVNEKKMEESLISRLKQVEKMQLLKEDYERMLERKIVIEKKQLQTVVPLEGRAKAILLQIQEALK
jgi:hypothetical protein